MHCPKCSRVMERIRHHEFEVERCVGCYGIWFEGLVEERLREVAGSEVIDIGLPEVGREYNRVGDIRCPRCTTPMVRMVDSRQPHLWYESCGSCYGTYFDAGEFRDYTHSGTLADRIRDFLAHERH